jgi:serine/threonine protein phosphatase 1
MRKTELVAPVVANGDVHGCASLLDGVLEQYRGSGADLIFLGDLIDRSPQTGGDRKVLEMVAELQVNSMKYGLSKVTVLRGNHEQMLLDTLKEEKPGPATDLWEWNGGNPDLLPYAKQQLSWLKRLTHIAIRGQYLFVHAGVRPGVPIDKQKQMDLLWIRQPFLNKGNHGLPYVVVHGHTYRQDFGVTRLPHRIGIDTGAFISGKLTALRLNPTAGDYQGNGNPRNLELRTSIFRNVIRPSTCL